LGLYGRLPQKKIEKIMRKKQFTSALIILIILVIISVLTSSSKSSSRFEVGAKVFGQVDISKVNKIKFNF